MSRVNELHGWTLVLWDVDHTLIDTEGVSKETYARAFELLVGRRPRVEPETDGRTDFEIMRNLLHTNELMDMEVDAYQFIEALTVAGIENRDALRRRGHALPGAQAILDALRDNRYVLQSVLTGNIPANAYEKLAAFGLDSYVDLAVGGFGTDHIVRAELVGAARIKALEKYGLQFDRASTVLIGDTTRDVHAGLGGGARVLAIATGNDTVTDLWRAGADAVLPDLRDTKRVINVLVKLRMP